MSVSPYPLKLPESLQNAAEKLAREDGVSLNDWIASAVAEKIGAVESAENFLRRKIGDANGHELIQFLDAAPDVPAEAGDELPEGWRRER